MAKNIANDVVCFLSIEKKYTEFLGEIRHWNNLKMATDNELIWIKDLMEWQINSLEIKSIPYKKLYYEIDNKLFLINSKLPECTFPSLLWTPIDRALQIKMPTYNYNYFGITAPTNVQLIATENEQPSFGLLTSIAALEKYIKTAPAVRFQHLSWVIVEHTKALILGNPTLPIQGDTLWQSNTMLFPSGFDLELTVLKNILECQLNKTDDNWIIWAENASYHLIEKEKFMPLSISSVMKSITPKFMIEYENNK